MTDTEYLNWGWQLWNGGERGDNHTRLYKTKLVKTRQPHTCYAEREGHEIPAGSRAFLETAIVDGKWSSCYTCLPCIESWKRECDPEAP